MSEQDSQVKIDMIIEPASRGKKEMIIESIIGAGSITCANVNADDSDSPPRTSSTAKIPRVVQWVREKTDDYEKDYVPKVVSIGPYHFGNPKLESAEKLKPVFTMKFLENSDSTLRSLYDKLGDPLMVHEIRSFYEEGSTNIFCDEDFTKMMLLDSCFILYYIQFGFHRFPSSRDGFKAHQIHVIKRDLFLLENQIPFKVLREVVKLLDIKYLLKINLFIYDNIFPAPTRPKKLVSWLQLIMFWSSRNDRNRGEEGLTWETLLGSNNNPPDHLLHLLYDSVVNPVRLQHSNHYKHRGNNKYVLQSFSNAKELVDVGINFKPARDTCRSFAYVKFVKRWWGFSANVELPPLTIGDFTKPTLKNLLAYESSSHWFSPYTPIASYVDLLQSLIEQPEDVKALRKAWVLDNCSGGSDKDVVDLFRDLQDAVSSCSLNSPYMDVMVMMESHYKSWRSTLFSQLNHEYIKSPWSFLALAGALVALFLSAVQTYFTVWSPKS